MKTTKILSEKREISDFIETLIDGEYVNAHIFNKDLDLRVRNIRQDKGKITNIQVKVSYQVEIDAPKTELQQ